MHIVHFSAGRINPAAAKVGTANVIYWLAREQALAGHRVTVVVLPQKKDYANVQDADVVIREYRSPSLAGFVLDRRLAQDIDRGDLPIDIAHLHGLWAAPMVAVGALLRKRGIPYVVSSHGSFGPNLRARLRVRKQVFRWLFGLPLANHAALIHVHSQGEVQAARDFGARGRMVIAAQGIDLSEIPWEPRRDWFRRNYPQHGSSFKIVYLGRLDPWYKGIDLLLPALANALRARPDLTLFLIGPEKRRYRTQIPALIEKLGLGSRVVMPGPIFDLEEKYGALAGADCFILPSRSEGFPLAVLEAMGCGIPVIVTPDTNTAEIVSENHAGLVCQLSVESITECLQQISGDAAARLEMGRRAREAAAQYTWKRAAALLLDAYQREVAAR